MHKKREPSQIVVWVQEKFSNLELPITENKPTFSDRGIEDKVIAKFSAGIGKLKMLKLERDCEEMYLNKAAV